MSSAPGDRCCIHAGILSTPIAGLPTRSRRHGIPTLNDLLISNPMKQDQSATRTPIAPRIPSQPARSRGRPAGRSREFRETGLVSGEIPSPVGPQESGPIGGSSTSAARKKRAQAARNSINTVLRRRRRKALQVRPKPSGPHPSSDQSASFGISRALRRSYRLLGLPRPITGGAKGCLGYAGFPNEVDVLLMATWDLSLTPAPRRRASHNT